MSSPIGDIIAASARGDLTAVRAHLEKDPSLATSANMFGTTAIHAAHFSGHPDIVALVFSYRSMDGFLAAELGSIKELRDCLQKDPGFAGRRNSAGFTALHGACYWGNIEAARILLDHGADVNVRTTDGFLQIHPLGCAVASPDVPNPSQDEAVVLRLVDLLLDRGAAIDAKRRDGMTALHAAAFRGHLTVIRRLLERGANATLRANDDGGPHAGQSPADTAASQGHETAAALLRGAMK